MQQSAAMQSSRYTDGDFVASIRGPSALAQMLKMKPEQFDMKINTTNTSIDQKNIEVLSSNTHTESGLHVSKMKRSSGSKKISILPKIK